MGSRHGAWDGNANKLEVEQDYTERSPPVKGYTSLIRATNWGPSVHTPEPMGTCSFKTHGGDQELSSGLSGVQGKCYPLGHLTDYMG